MEVNSPKITIPPYEMSDVDDFMIYAGDDRVSRFTRWDTFTSKDEALAYIKDFCIPHPYCRSICVGDRSIGLIMIMPRSDVDQCRAQIGYALASEYWGRGIVARALKMAIVEALKEFPHLVRLQAFVEAENKAELEIFPVYLI